MSRVTLIFSIMLAVVLSLPSVAHGELRNPYGETRGMTWEAAVGVNGLTSDDHIVTPWWSHDVDPLIGLSAAGHYRPIDYLSVGALFHYGFIALDVDNIDDDVAGFFAGLIEMRGHFPVGRFDPWVGFGFGFALTFAGYRGDWMGIDYHYNWRLFGVGFGVGTGLNIFVTRNLALAPFFRMIFGVYPGACYLIESDLGDDEDCNDLEDVYSGNEPNDLPHLWIVGLAIMYSMGS